MPDRFISPVRRAARAWRVGALALAAALAATSAARGELLVDITQGSVQPLPIAITDFFGRSADAAQIGADLAAVIGADLERSGLFRPLPAGAFPQSPGDLQEGTPAFSAWRGLQAQALVSGSAATAADGQLEAQFRLWDVISGEQITGFVYNTEPGNWRRIAHIIADAIYQRLTGEQGYFDTRIVYVAESGPSTARVKRLAIMDQDGANHRYLTNGDHLVLTPRFSPSTQDITYVAFINEQPRVYLFNIDSGRQELLGTLPGMTFAPRFSPDGRSVILASAAGGNSDIYIMDLSTRQQRRLTSHPAIDTAPSMSPDGARVVFESDRSGSQQLYVISAGGGEATRISFGEGRYATPVWSPRGDLIAFTKILGGRFSIGVMRPDGGGERILADGYLVEGPTWSPNGRVLLYFTQTPSDAQGRVSTRIYSVDLTGANRRPIETPGDASDPAWSPPIP